MMGIEELTKEELIQWIRENIPDMNEEEVVLQMLYARSELSWEKSTAASKRAREANAKIISLVDPYADGPIKSGVRLRNFPVTVQKEYDRLDQERKTAWEDWDLWFHKSSEAHKKIISIYEARSDRAMEAFEKTKDLSMQN